MVFASATADKTSRLLGPVHGLLTFKVRSTEHRGRILRIRSPKCTIGSDPSCTLRLRGAGVSPFHCVVLRGGEGTFIRRWSQDTCLNGAGFTDAWLQPGDRLNIGPIELELLEPSSGAGTNRSDPTTAARATTARATTARASAGTIAALPSDAQCQAAINAVSDELACDTGCTRDDSCTRDDDRTQLTEQEQRTQEGICGNCEQDRHEVESALATRAQQADLQRSQLVQQNSELSDELQKREASCRQLAETNSQLDDQRTREQNAYRDSLDELRDELKQLKERHTQQLDEQQTLVAHAAAAEHQVVELKTELQTMRQAAESTQEQASISQCDLGQQIKERDEQLATAQQELSQQQDEAQNWQRQIEESVEQLENLRRELDSVQQQYRSQCQELEALQETQEESRKYRETSCQELQALRQELEAAEQELQSAREQVHATQQQQEATRRELEEVRQQQAALNDTLETLKAERETDRQELDTARQQLQAARQQLDENQQSADHDVQNLLQQRDEIQQQHESSRLELEEVRRQHSATCQELESLRQQQEGDGQELESTCQELQNLRQQLEELSTQSEAERCEQASQLGQLSGQLDAAAEKLMVSEDWATQLQSQLDQARDQVQQAAKDNCHIEQIQQLEQQVAAAQAALATEQEQWQEQREQWDLAEKQLREQLHKAGEGLQEATQSLETARSRSTQLETLLAETSQEMTQRDQVDHDLRREGEEIVQELARYRDLADSARSERQQERGEHQRVRNEWHIERVSLQAELAERSQSLDELQANHAEEIEEAQFLIQSLQQEGKRLLAQLDEAKHELRHDGENRKTGQRAVRESTAETMLMPGLIGEDDAQAASPMGLSDSIDPATQTPASSHAPSNASGQDATDVRSEPVTESSSVPELSQTIAFDRDGGDRDGGKLNAEVTESDSTPSDEAPGVAEGGTMVLDAQQLQDQAQERLNELAGVPQEVASLFSAPTGQAAEPESEEDDEGVIQNYMERLLKRVASVGKDEPEVSPTPTPPPAQPAVEEVEAVEAVEAVADHDVASEDVGLLQESSSEIEPDLTVDQPALQRAPAVTATNLLAMRELANHSAREAIQSCDKRRYATLAVGRIFVASICLVASGMVIVLSPNKLGVPASGGAIGLVFGSAMFLRGCRKFFSSQRMQESTDAQTDSPDPQVDEAEDDEC